MMYGNGMVIEHTIFDKLLLISDLLQRDMNHSFVGTPLTPARVGVLWVLQHLGPSTQQSIASALSVSARHVSGLVDVLEKHEYVRREPHPSDRRAVIVDLTPDARAMVEEMQRRHTAVTANLLGAVDAADLPAVERGIEAIVVRLTELVHQSEAETDADAETKSGGGDEGRLTAEVRELT